MQIINIFVAIIVALGFWNKSTKERDLATKKATLSKTVILFILTSALIFFYYKTYQVATFNNIILINGVKGSYDTYSKNYEGDTIHYNISKDRVSSFKLINRFSDRSFDLSDPLYDLYRFRKKSGFKVNLTLDNVCNSTKLYPSPFLINDSDSDLIEFYEYCYDVTLFNNKIPSLSPFFIYNNWTYSGGGHEPSEIPGDTTIFLDNHLFGRKNLYKKYDYEIIYRTRLATYEKHKNICRSIYNEHINSLNFFSAADLSQCIYQFDIRSDIPVDSFFVYFDIPIEVTPYYDKQKRLDSRCFSIDVQEKNDGTVDQFFSFHIKLPTLANYQLIRSLILTTLLTALLSLFFSNLYYYCRKHYIKYLIKKPVSFEKRKKLLLVWIPTGKTVVWTIILLSTVALLLLILNRPIILNAVYFNDAFFIKIFSIFILIVIILYCYCVYRIFLILREDSLHLERKRKKKKNKMNYLQISKLGVKLSEKLKSRKNEKNK